MLQEALRAEADFVVFGPLFCPFVGLNVRWVLKRKCERTGILLQWICAPHVSGVFADSVIGNQIHVRRCGQLVSGDPEYHERVCPTVHHACVIGE